MWHLWGSVRAFQVQIVGFTVCQVVLYIWECQEAWNPQSCYLYWTTCICESAEENGGAGEEAKGDSLQVTNVEELETVTPMETVAPVESAEKALPSTLDEDPAPVAASPPAPAPAPPKYKSAPPTPSKYYHIMNFNMHIMLILSSLSLWSQAFLTLLFVGAGMNGINRSVMWWWASLQRASKQRITRSSMENKLYVSLSTYLLIHPESSASLFRSIC